MKQVAKNVLHSINWVVWGTQGDIEDKSMRDEGKKAQDWLRVDTGAVSDVGAK